MCIVVWLGLEPTDVISLTITAQRIKTETKLYWSQEMT